MLCGFIFLLYLCTNGCLAQNETDTFNECKINGTVLIGRLTADMECIICDIGEYFNSTSDKCLPCEGFLTNNEKNILPTCINRRESADHEDYTTTAVPIQHGVVNATTRIASREDIESADNENYTTTAVPIKHDVVDTTTTIASTTVVPTTHQTATEIVDSGHPKMTCNKESCDLTLSGNKTVMENMLKVTSKIFSEFKDSAIDKLRMIGFNRFMISLGLKNHTQEDFLTLKNSTTKENVDTNSTCITWNSLVEDYFGSVHSLTMNDFILLLPRILIDVQNHECRDGEDDDHENGHHEDENGHHEEHDEEGRSAYYVWLIGFASVFVISILSVIGVLLVPMMRHSTFYNRLISFLVALAVGTLIGDALLHLLPHATGIHDEEEGHETHMEEPNEEEHFNTVWKGLIAVTGIYIFYLVETLMVIIKDFKERRKQQRAGDNVSMKKSHSNHSHGSHNHHHDHGISQTHSVSPLLDDQNGNTPQNGEAQKTLALLKDEEDVFENDHHKKHHHQSMESMVQEDGPHHHVQSGTHIHMHEHEVPSSIANLAWMVVMGDGLHNFSDGLAIGAAFTSSIGAGLSTSIAVFCHELPHELGDFAILINAGMTVKQALLYNFLCACLAFVGLVIGLIIGEYTNTYKLWILAFTAGGFLYIALVDMIPQMLTSLRERDATIRFISQNIGLLIGITLMLLIALREHSFEAMFS